MRKLLFAALSTIVMVCFFLVANNTHVIKTTSVAPAPHPSFGLDFRSLEQDLSNPSLLSDLATTLSSGDTTPVPIGRRVRPPIVNKNPVTQRQNPEEKMVELQQLDIDNKTQLYNVLLHALESEGLEGTDFRDFVLATLEQIGNDAPGAILAALVLNAPDQAHRLRALQLLNQAGQELSFDDINLALNDHDPGVRQFARALLDGIGTAALLDALTEAVLDHNQAVRLMAFTTMEEMHEFAPIWEIADQFVNDHDPQIRMRALELLTYGDQQFAIDRLVLALGDPNPDIRELAEDLLAELEQDIT